MNYKIVEISDKCYPNLLKGIYDPPSKLYCIGDVSLLNEIGVAIIGCRNASPYGIKIAKIIADNLSKNGVTIISGFARGIDTISHLASYKNIGKTIAVLGSGLDVIYPSENEKLFYDIIENGGLIISEYPFGTKPDKDNFPKRNRIISALSQCVIVIEAKKKSGTMITVDCALEQGKTVFAVPGNIDSLNSEGTNELIKQGATPLTSYSDILRFLAQVQNIYLKVGLLFSNIIF